MSDHDLLFILSACLDPILANDFIVTFVFTYTKIINYVKYILLKGSPLVIKIRFHILAY